MSAPVMIALSMCIAGAFAGNAQINVDSEKNLIVAAAENATVFVQSADGTKTDLNLIESRQRKATADVVGLVETLDGTISGLDKTFNEFLNFTMGQAATQAASSQAGAPVFAARGAQSSDSGPTAQQSPRAWSTVSPVFVEDGLAGQKKLYVVVGQGLELVVGAPIYRCEWFHNASGTSVSTATIEAMSSHALEFDIPQWNVDGSAPPADAYDTEFDCYENGALMGTHSPVKSVGWVAAKPTIATVLDFAGGPRESSVEVEFIITYPYGATGYADIAVALDTSWPLTGSVIKNGDFVDSTGQIRKLKFDISVPAEIKESYDFTIPVILTQRGSNATFASSAEFTYDLNCMDCKNCHAIYAQYPNAVDGIYDVFPTAGEGPIQVYCDFDAATATGWTLVFFEHQNARLDYGSRGQQTKSGMTFPIDYSKTAGSAKFADTLINKLKTYTSNKKIAYRLTSPGKAASYYAPSECVYQHNSHNDVKCRRYTTTFKETSPSYVECSNWGGGGGGLNFWYRCSGSGYTNVAITHRHYTQSSGFTDNTNGASGGGSNTQYNLPVAMWVR